MASINTSTNERIYSLKKWLGVNQSPDGDTKLKHGEASEMRNWKVTRDGNLQRRPGTVTICDLETEGRVSCLWSGRVAGKTIILAASEGNLYEVFNGSAWVTTSLGVIDTTRVYIFAFDEKAYIMDGDKYREYDGTTLKEVEGYVPLVSTTTSPAGAGVLVEQVNKLTGKRRALYSPDGTESVFHLPEKGVTSVDSVKVNGTTVTGYTVDTTNGTVTFTSAPAEGVNTVEIAWTVPNTFRSQIAGMHYAEIFNGYQDSRVFVYGDGSNLAYYSGLDENGRGRADYFPDMNVCAVGETNTPITSMIRHYNRLLAFKSNSTYSIAYSTITTDEGSVIPSFTVSTINRAIGCAAYGQAQLVLNYPRTVFGKDAYEWRNTSSYTSLTTSDERQAQRISDRVHVSLGLFPMSSVVCWDDNDNQEYYICYNKNAVVHNYVTDAWYTYTNFDAESFCNLNGELYIGSSDGKIKHVTSRALDDDGEPIDAYWESGAMDFNSEYMRKYTSSIWVTVKPQSNSYVEITAITDRKSNFAEKVIATGSGGFADWDFGSFTFSLSEEASIKKLRLKAKKYAFYKVVFKTDKAGSTATILSADIRVRQTGYAK